MSSSIRFKEDVEDLGELSAALMELRPVSFRYKNEGGGSDTGQSWGLIAEEVAEVFPELVHYDDEGKPSGVRYSRLTPLLLNELQKQFKENRTQKRQLAEQRRELRRLSARLSKLEASK